MDARQMTPFFPSTFSTLTVYNIHFGQKLPIWTTHHTFLDSRHPEVTRGPLRRAKKKLLAHGLSVKR